MSMTCEEIRDRLPEWVGSGEELPREVELHLTGCPACAEELETLSLLIQGRPRVPPGLEARIQAAVLEAARGSDRRSVPVRDPEDEAIPLRPRRRAWSGPTWGLAAAAVMALLLGRTLVDTGEIPVEGELLTSAEPTVFLEEDVIAGAPVLDGLTDEDLALLLEEFEG